MNQIILHQKCARYDTIRPAKFLIFSIIIILLLACIASSGSPLQNKSILQILLREEFGPFSSRVDCEHNGVVFVTVSHMHNAGQYFPLGLYHLLKNTSKMSSFLHE